MREKHPLASEMPAMNFQGDMVAGYSRGLLKMLMLKRHLDCAIKAGDGEGVLLSLKFMLLYFKVLGNTKYALACFEAIAQNQFFLSEKMKVLVLQECFVNNLGRPLSNIPMDQDVEFQNKQFKESFHYMHGEPSDTYLSRLSKSVDSVEKVLENFAKQFDVESFHTKRKVPLEEYIDNVVMVSKKLTEAKVFYIVPHRKLYSAKLASAAIDPLSKLDLCNFKGWMVSRFQSMLDSTIYKY